MLPDFPAIKEARSDHLSQLAFRESRARHDMLNRLGGPVRQPEGDKVVLTDVDGQPAMTGYERFESGEQVRAEEMPELDDEHWLHKYKSVTNKMSEEQVKLLLRRMDEITTASGNVINAHGDPLAEEHILKIFERAQLDFENGQLSPTFGLVMGPQLADRLRTMEFSDDFKKKYAGIVERQYLEWRLRQADRKLVD